MNPCQDCEDGRCPCGTGCLGCELTGVCTTCNGTATQDAPTAADLRFTRQRKPRAGTLRPVKPMCTVCRRVGYPHDGPPDFSALRAQTPGTYRREMKARRCTGCHRRFMISAPKTPSYTLMEAT